VTICCAIGICRTYEWNKAQSKTLSALEESAKSLARAGAVVQDVELPPAFAGLAGAKTDIMGYEAALPCL
jgi:Asp-tRNA(Asn)/Glu-tRNA(Gln) amidotransferase A subunit family amidase